MARYPETSTLMPNPQGKEFAHVFDNWAKDKGSVEIKLFWD